MSKVKAPFLSLGATGSVAAMLTSSKWKGVKTMRQHANPSNPKTSEQTTKRSAFASAVAAFRSYLTATATREALNVAARVSSKTQSGFNLIVSAMSQALASDTDPSFCSSVAAGDNQVAEFSMINIDDGATGDEAGNFEVWAGDAPGSLLLNGTAAIAAGVVTSGDLGDEGDQKYVQLRKGGLARSGIHLITLAADADPDLVVTGNIDPPANGNYFEDGLYNGYMSYARGDGAFYISVHSLIQTWMLAPCKADDIGAGMWSGPPQSHAPAEDYIAGGSYTGTATVATP